MNIRANLTVVALLSGFALASNPAKADVLGFSVSLPTISTLTAEVGKTIAADVAGYLRNAVSAPRATHKRKPPSVTVRILPTAETAGIATVSGIETVTVVASRLPSIETVTVIASRLPEIETVTVVASRLPEIETVTVVASRLPAVEALAMDATRTSYTRL